MSTKSSNLIPDILRSIFVGDIVKDQKLVSVLSSDTLDLVSERLTLAGVSSLPIFSKPHDLTSCVGVIDFSDLASVVLELKHRGYDELTPSKNIWKTFSATTVAKAFELSKPKHIQLSIKTPILEAVEKISQFGLRRMLATNSKNEVIGILSPSEIMKHILSAVDGKSDLTLSKTVSELSLGLSPVLSCRKRESVITAFKRMREADRAAIAIIGDTTNSLQGSLSMSDIQFIIKEEKSHHLNTSCWKYITHIKQQEIDAIFPFFGVSENSNLATVMSKLLSVGIHHLYVVDNEGNPLSVIGFNDICGGLLTSLTL